MSRRYCLLLRGSIPFGDFAGLLSIKTNEEYQRSIRKLTNNLPYKTSSWPSFGEYVEDWYKVEVGEFKRQLLYCERGSCDVRENCENLVDLSYHILNVISPNLTLAASKTSENLDRIKDQRLLIWLRMSSEIYHMFQVNRYFGIRMLSSNVTWMCQELVRMGVFSNTLDAFKSELHIIKGLMLSGATSDFVSELYRELQNA